MTFHQFRAKSRPLKSNMIAIVMYFVCNFVYPILLFVRLTEKRANYKKFHVGWVIFLFCSTLLIGGTFIGSAVFSLNDDSPPSDKGAVFIILITMGLTYVASWILTLIYNSKLDRQMDEWNDFREKLEHSYSLVQSGVLKISNLIQSVDLPEKELIDIVVHFIQSNRLPGYYFNAELKELVAVGSSRQRSQVAWKCTGCGANNNLWFYEGDHAACEYCGQKKED